MLKILTFYFREGVKNFLEDTRLLSTGYSSSACKGQRCYQLELSMHHGSFSSRTRGARFQWRCRLFPKDEDETSSKIYTPLFVSFLILFFAKKLQNTSLARNKSK